MRSLRAPILMAAFTLPILSGAVVAGFEASDVPLALTASRESAVEPSLCLPAGTIMRVASAARVKPSRLRAGDELWTELPRPLFLRERRVLPSATRVRLVVEQVHRVKTDAGQSSGGNSLLPWPLARLVPRRRYAIAFRSAEIIMADGMSVPFKPSLVEVRDGGRVRIGVLGERRAAPTATDPVPEAGVNRSSGQAASASQGSTFILRLDEPVTLPPHPESRRDQGVDADASSSQEVRVRLMLLAPLSAAKNREGESFLARVLEPLRLGNQLLVPEGSTVQGRIAWRKPPRRLRRTGLMRLSFGKVSSPDGGAAEISASLLSVEALPSSRMTLDAEGTLRARAATRKCAAIDLGVAYLVGKVTDDMFEEGVKAGVSAAATGSVTTAARYLGIGVGLVYFFAQRGRDVALPEYTELEIVIARPGARGENPAPPPASLPD